MAKKLTTAEEFAAAENQDDTLLSSAANAALPQEDADLTRPALTLNRLVTPKETVGIVEERDGKAVETLYELAYLARYSVGKQTGLLIDRTRTNAFRTIEEEGGELDADQEAQQLFLLRKLARHALPDLDAAVVNTLSLLQLESIATLFFDRSVATQDSVPAARRRISAD